MRSTRNLPWLSALSYCVGLELLVFIGSWLNRGEERFWIYLVVAFAAPPLGPLMCVALERRGAVFRVVVAMMSVLVFQALLHNTPFLADAAAAVVSR